MHAYGHQWTCQLAYNPRFKVGLGLSDGEGVERLWSRMRKLVALTRVSAVSFHSHPYVTRVTLISQRSKRLQLLDEQARALVADLQKALVAFHD